MNWNLEILASYQQQTQNSYQEVSARFETRHIERGLVLSPQRHPFLRINYELDSKQFLCSPFFGVNSTFIKIAQMSFLSQGRQ